MEYRVLGRTGLRVSRFGLGTMVFGSWGNRDRASCVGLIKTAITSGINLVDTADIYGEGESEEIVGEALVGMRDEVILATKFDNPMGPGINQRGSSRRWMVQALDASLKRLRTDWIDLYQVHRPDPATDPEELVEAMTDMVRAGKIRYWGTSNFAAEDIVELSLTARHRSAIRPHSEQSPYSILCRAIERDVLGVCQRHGLGVLVWSPLSGGWLTGKYEVGEPAPTGSRGQTHPDHFDGGNPDKFEVVAQLAVVAKEAGLTLTNLSLAWAVEHPAVSAALLGPRTESQLLSLLEADVIELDDATLDAVDRVVRPGVNINPADTGAVLPGLAPEARRRV